MAPATYTHGSGDDLMSADYCCEDMRRNVEHRCAKHAHPYDCPDIVVVGKAGQWFGLPIHDGGRASIEILHCPWCGAVLPRQSLED